MFAGGPLILSALSLIQAEARYEAGARIETQVGQAPTGTSAPSSGQTQIVEQAQVMVQATPILGLHWLDDVDDLRANSATRVLWRPVPLLRDRPLFLETIEASHSRQASKRTRWQLDLRGSYGEEDYTSLTQQFANQPTLPTAATVLLVNATAAAAWRGTRRTTLTMQLDAIHRRSFDNPATVSGTTGAASTVLPQIPTQTAVTATPGLRYTLSRRTRLETFAVIADTDVQGNSQPADQSGGMNVLSLQPEVGILEKLTRRHELHLLLGLTYASELRHSATSRGQPWHSITPVLQVDFNSVLRRTRSAIVRSLLRAGMAWFEDPILGAAALRSVAEARVDADLGQSWSVGAHGAFATDLTALSSTGTTLLDETIVSAEIPVRHRFSSQWVAEFGARYAERGPYLGASSFAWRNREIWLFLSLLAISRPAQRALAANGPAGRSP